MSAASPLGRLVLAADVGGTNLKLALARCGGGEREILGRTVYHSRDYTALAAAVTAFLNDLRFQGCGPVAAACFAVAGPVENGRARLTNLPWGVDEDAVARELGIPHVRVINDFAAAGLGIAELAESDFLTLQGGSAIERGDRVVIGAGTGLGVAWLIWDGERHRYRVHPSEGGHADFAPNDALQDELLAHLRRERGHVSAERVLSGPALAAIFDFLRQRDRIEPISALAEAMTKGDPAGAIAEFALSGGDSLAVRALDLFVSAYGAFAGNMALVALAHGGIYVAGGIAPKIAKKLEDGTFIRAFRSKGRFRALLESIPVKVVKNEQVGLLGAVAEAARLAQR
jgi:glucokinase